MTTNQRAPVSGPTGAQNILPSRRVAGLTSIYAFALSFVGVMLRDVIPGGFVFTLLLWLIALVCGVVYIVLQRIAIRNGAVIEYERNLSMMQRAVIGIVAIALLLMLTSLFFDAVDTGAGAAVAVLALMMVVGAAISVWLLIKDLHA